MEGYCELCWRRVSLIFWLGHFGTNGTKIKRKGQKMGDEETQDAFRQILDDPENKV
jgi:hypothetical protein